jgi:hydrogenase maturation protein HypF
MDRLPAAAPARILACGAFLKNAACLLEGDRVLWTPVHGDLDDPTARRELIDSLERLVARAAGPIAAVAHDLHPDFPSTRLALEIAQRLGIPAIGVQHHVAHVAAVCAEQGLDGPVIGVALDGTGLGSDGTAWGGELLALADGRAAHRWRRLAHLPALRLPGGDVAAREPWRLVAAVLHGLGRGSEIVPRLAPAVGEPAARTIAAMLARGLNCPAACGAGRWFDAAAGALGLSVRQSAEAEAAIALERLAAAALRAEPSIDAGPQGLDLAALVAGLLDVERGDAAAVARGAARFHVALADGLADAAAGHAATLGARRVVLGGGCFANAVLRERLSAGLRARGLAVHLPDAKRCGDATLAIGQAWVAAGSLGEHRRAEPSCGAAGGDAAPRVASLEVR